MNVEVPGEIERLPGLVDALLAAWAERELPADQLFAFDLALEEVFTNLAIHARGPVMPLRVAVRLEAGDGEVLLEICDDGDPFDPLSAPAPDLESPLEDRRIGGLGVHLVRRFFPDVRYERIDGRNVLSLRRPLG